MTMMSPPTVQYFAVAVATLGACYLGSRLAVRHPGPTLAAALVALAIFALNRTFTQAQPGTQDSNVQLFDTLKALSVLVPSVIFAYCNLKLRHRKDVPASVGHLFSAILCLNILETIILAVKAPGVQGLIYAGTAAVLALSVLLLRWNIAGGVLGFSDKPLVLSYLACISYLLLFLYPIGSGWLSWLVLLVAYIPFSRTGHDWIAHRAYSLWIFHIVAHALGLMPFFRSPPAFVIEFMTSLRQSALNEVVLITAVGSVVVLIVHRASASRSSRARRAALGSPE